MTSRPSGAGRAKTGWILIASLTVGSIASAGAVWWYYHRQLAAMEEAAARELLSVSDNKTSQIANWRRERLGDGQVLMSSPVMRIARRLLAGRASQADQSDLWDTLQHLQAAFEYSGAVLCDLDGAVHLAVGQPSTDPSRLRDLAAEAVRINDAALSDLRLDPAGARPLMALIVPVAASGAIVFDIDPERFLYPYLNLWSGHSQSAETLLIRRDGKYALYLSDLRHQNGAPLRYRRDVSGLGLPPDSAFDTGRLFRGLDYHGDPVLAIIRHIPNSLWFISTKIDAAEVDAPERRLGWEMALITGLIGLVNVAGAALVLRVQSARARQEKLEWFVAIANDTPAYLWMANPQDENSFINAPLARFLGTIENRLSKDWTGRVHPEDADHAHATFMEAVRTQSAYTHEFRMRRHDGEYRWVVSKAVPRFSRKGRFLGFAGSVLDITGRRLAEHRLKEANASLAAELAESTRKEEEIQGLTARLIDAQEEERKRLARELHDDLSQQIAALSIATGCLKRQIPEDRVEARVSSDRIHDKLVHLAEGVRRMSHELHPAILQYSGLAPALRSYCEEFGALSGIQVSLAISGSFESVPPAVALSLFRIAQEALRNVAKHARVPAASVELRRGGGMIELTISDAGTGMEVARIGAKAGLGLLNIQERARLVRGKVQIHSEPGKGTRVSVQVPES